MIISPQAKHNLGAGALCCTELPSNALWHLSVCRALCHSCMRRWKPDHYLRVYNRWWHPAVVIGSSSSSNEWPQSTSWLLSATARKWVGKEGGDGWEDRWTGRDEEKGEREGEGWREIEGGGERERRGGGRGREKRRKQGGERVKALG